MFVVPTGLLREDLSGLDTNHVKSHHWRKHSDMKQFTLFLILVLLLSGCGFPAAGVRGPLTPTVLPTATVTYIAPTRTSTPTLTVTPLPPTPDLKTIGLPSEPAGSVALDFVAQMCDAQWYTEGGSLPCPGDASQADSGYVMRIDKDVPGVSIGFPMLLTYPPVVHYATISSKYPPFTVQKGDRFRAVMTCEEHSYCDVMYLFNYFNHFGRFRLAQWHYLFTDKPLVVDYSLDNIAGQTVQFDLAVEVKGNRPDMYAVWVAPHIYRPSP